MQTEMVKNLIGENFPHPLSEEQLDDLFELDIRIRSSPLEEDEMNLTFPQCLTQIDCPPTSDEDEC